MASDAHDALVSRRRFIGCAAAASVFTYLGSFGEPTLAQEASTVRVEPELEFKYRTVSVSHLGELKAWLEKLSTEGKLSDNAKYREYIGGFEYAPPKEVPDARSLVVLAIPGRLATFTFHRNGKAHEFLVPTGYVDDGITGDMLKAAVRKRVLKDENARLKGARLPLKSLAVHSGLAEYGRNNITFVEGYGSYHALIAVYTDKALEDQWQPLTMMRLCKGCSICADACLTRAIRDESFVVDVGRCVTLYNELPDPIPATLDPRIHNSIVGCLKCQVTCPANKELGSRLDRVADLDERETAFLLDGGDDARVKESIAAKMKRFPSGTDLAYLARNLRLAWPNVVGA